MRLRHLRSLERNSSKQLFPVYVKLSINRKKIESEIVFPEKQALVKVIPIFKTNTDCIKIIKWAILLMY